MSIHFSDFLKLWRQQQKQETSINSIHFQKLKCNIFFCFLINIFYYIRIDNLLAKRKTTKEKLAVWLETVCCIMDQYVIPWLEKAAPLSDEVEKLKSENIDDQKTVISLQNKLIEAHEKNVESVQNVVKTTVETEMKTYASAVTKSCSSALVPRKIVTAFKKVKAKEERSQNIMIYGMVESQ